MLSPATEPVQITVVENEICHFCTDARQALAALVTRFPIKVDSMDVRGTPAGADGPAPGSDEHAHTAGRPLL